MANTGTASLSTAALPLPLVWTLALAAFALGALPAQALTIRSDELWQAARCPPEQTAPRSDDASAWMPAAYPWLFLTPRSFPADAAARPMWESSGFRYACLQRVFDLPNLPTDAAIAHLWVDELYQLSLNDQVVGSSTKKFEHARHDVTALLRPGRNVIRLQVDGRYYTRGAIFSLQIPGVPDEPLTARQRIERTTPWLILVIVLVAIVTLTWMAVWLRRRATPYLARVPSAAWVAGMLLLAAVAEGIFLSQPFYQAEWIHPWCWWSWPVVAAGVVAMMALVLWGSGDRPCTPPASALCDGKLGDRCRCSAGSESRRVCAGSGCGPSQRARRARATAVLERAPRHSGSILTAIVVLAAILRIYGIDNLPPGMWIDESINGNEAIDLYSNAEAGLQIWSNSVGGRGTLFLYLIGAALDLFGVSYLTLKIAPVAMGILAVPAMYALGRIAFNPTVGLWAAFLIAVSRSHIHYSRMAWEAICVPTFAALGFALLLDGLRGGRWARLSAAGGGAVLGAGLYTYAAFRALAAVAALFLTAGLLHPLARRNSGRAMLFAAATAIAVSTPLLLYAYRNPQSYWQRYADVSLTHFMEYYGTPLPWLHQLGRSLLSINHKGDEIVRHNLPDAPHFDPITGALFLIGLATVAGARASAGPRLLWIWLFTYAAIASLTRDGPHATRLIGLMPVVTLFAAYGLWRLLERLGSIRRSYAWALAVVVVIGVSGRNVYEYFVL
ncbi:MAG TPA: glycosyltransferase family 39 protein, partial [Terriglobales bacterium]|nr:glycosyltransferase family 39 protein [Terriglobales bacterium]